MATFAMGFVVPGGGTTAGRTGQPPGAGRRTATISHPDNALGRPRAADSQLYRDVYAAPNQHDDARAGNDSDLYAQSDTHVNLDAHPDLYPHAHANAYFY
jgi:hypothetical protein